MLIDDIALTMHPEVGCRTVIHLLERFGSAERVYAATEQELCQEAGLKPAVARSILRRETHLKAQKELDFATRRHLRILTSDAQEYPARLRECGDYPHVLYVSGGLDFNRGYWLSVVGTRKMTPYGSRICETLIEELVRIVPDLVVVSGLAYGVDVAAHRAALKYGIPTVGVLGHPITRIYPLQHTDTARRMVTQGGAVLSEFASDEEPSRAGFVQRNRLIAGLSEGTLIVESAARGGSLITADMADGYHRTLMAVPGRVGDLYSEGTNQLIRTLKAQMVCSGAEIVEVMNWDAALSGTGERELWKNDDTSEGVGSAERKSSGEEGQNEKVIVEKTDRTNASLRVRTRSRDVVEVDRPMEERSTQEMISGHPTLSAERRSGSVEEEGLSPAARRVLDLLDRDEAIGWDELAVKAPFPSADLALLLLDLEFQGRICSLPGNRYLKC